MNNNEILTNEFINLINEAANHLIKLEYEEAYQYIMKAINKDPNAPQPHNLLGIWYEFKGQNELARKHYRVAYVLNPVYKPASINLERVSTLFLDKHIPVDFGEIIIEETKNELK